jgi:hypothetical protein
MSTKVYNFYRYVPNDIFQLYEWLKELRVLHTEYVLDELQTFAPIKDNTVDFEKLLKRIEHDTKTGLRSPYNIDGSACIYLHEDQIYVHFFANETFLDEHIKDDGILIDCHYQNQSDQSEDVSDEEWQKRRELVKAIGILDQAPSRVGMIFVLADENDASSFAWNIRIQSLVS